MSDWYDEGVNKIRIELAEAAGITAEQANKAYGFLNEVGLIDYDIEKDVLYERYNEEGDD